MKKLNESFFEIKKSKFYGYLYQIDSEEEVSDILNLLKIEHKKSKHLVYAYKIGNIEKKTDDKEPSNTAGKPLLDIINFKKIDNSLIVVVRYFGGILLGRGPLTRAYSNTASKLFLKICVIKNSIFPYKPVKIFLKSDLFGEQGNKIKQPCFCFSR